MNNSERKYYSLAGGQGPARCCSVGLGAAKANTLPASPRFSPVFQINRCLSQRALRPLLPDRGGHSPFVSNVAGYLQCCCPAHLGQPGTHRRASVLGWLQTPLPRHATLRGGHAGHSPRVAGPQAPARGQLGKLFAPQSCHSAFCPDMHCFALNKNLSAARDVGKEKQFPLPQVCWGCGREHPRAHRAMPGGPP